MKVSELKTNDLVKVYIQLRDRRAQRKAAYEKIEGILLQRFNEVGIESARTEFGTAYKETKVSATTGDKDAMLEWVLAEPEDRIGFLDVKPNKTAVRAYREQFDDLPPGVNWREEVTINVRRS